MNIKFPKKIGNNYQGYLFLLNIGKDTMTLREELIIFDFKETIVFESNLFSVLGYIVKDLELRNNRIRLYNLQEGVDNLINTKSFTYKKKIPVWQSFIKCWHFAKDQEVELSEYLSNRIFPEREKFSVDSQLRMAIELCVAEIYRNAYSHSRTRDLFVSHYFSTYNNKLYITLVNGGRSMGAVVNSFLKTKKSSVEAIEWLVKQGTTITKQSDKGNGLYTIRQFIEQNKGRILIFSGDGVWKQVKHRSFSMLSESNFRGSIVTLEFNI